MARKLIVEIVGDSRSYERALNKSATSTKQFGQAMGSTSPKLGKLNQTMNTAGYSAGLLAAAGVGLAFKLGGDAVTAASDLNEQISRTEVVLGKSADEMIAWSETTAQSMGISQRAALAATGTFAGLFQTVGVQRKEAGELSRSLVQLAADLASLQNSSPEEALLALRSGLAGEAEPLRRFNIFLTEARVNQQALADTGKKTTSALSQQEKTTARYNIIMRDSILAQGNFALTSGELANQQRIAKAEIDDLSASIGQVLVPAAEAAVGTLGLFASSLNNVIDAMGDFKKALADTTVFDGWNSAVESATTSAGDFFTNVRDGIPGMERFLDLRDRMMGGGGISPTFGAVAGAQPGIGGSQRAQGRAQREAQRVRENADKVNAAAGQQIINQITKQSAAQGNLNVQLANSEKRAAHLRDLIRADPDNAKLQQRLTAELKKQNGIREDQASLSKRNAADAKAAADAVKQAADDAKQAARERLMATLDLGEAQAQLTKGLKDDLSAAKTRESTLRRLVALNRQDLDLANQLVSATQARRDLEKQIAEQKRARVQSNIFKDLGLTAEGETPTPGSGALIKRAQSMLDNLKGMSTKNRSQLKTIVDVLKKNYKKAGKDVRAAILEMLNTIAGTVDKADKTGPLTKGAGLNTKKVLAGIGLSPEEVNELRGRLSSVSDTGRVLGRPGGGAATSRARAGGRGGEPPILVESHTTINLDGQRVANVVTKQQQKSRRRNPQQKRGPNRHR